VSFQAFEKSFQAFEKSFQALEKLEQILIKLFSKKFKSKKGFKGVFAPLMQNVLCLHPVSLFSVFILNRSG